MALVTEALEKARARQLQHDTLSPEELNTAIDSILTGQVTR